MGRKTNHQKRYENSGRPTKMTPEVLQKLEDAFMNAFTDKMACLYAGISEATFYTYCKDNPEFSERKERLKETPNLAAQKTLVGDISNVSGARWWAERRMADFKPTTKVEHTGEVEVVHALKLMSPEEKMALESFRIARRKRIELESDQII